MGVILHSTRSEKAGRVAEFDRTVSYMMQKDTVSSHRVIGVQRGQHAQMVENGLKAWHAEEDNAEWLSIEFSQPFPTDEYPDWQIDTGIAVVCEWFKIYNIVPSGRTIRMHSQTAQGKRSGKSDPGVLFPIGRFIKAVANA